jgi:hypothetical protein
MVNKFKALLATALIAASFSAQAGVIMTLNGQAVTDPTHTENFEGGTTGNNITDQFSANGLTFETLGTAGIALTSNNVCNNMSGGMSGKYLSMGLRFPCTGNLTYNAVSMMFDKDITELSWIGLNRTIANGFTVQVLHDGQVVSDASPMFQFNSSNQFNNQIVYFSGGVFDEIRFLENANYQGFFGIDNMAWKVAADVVIPPPVSDVPEPSIALLFGLGMVGMIVMRKKKAA